MPTVLCAVAAGGCHDAARVPHLHRPQRSEGAGPGSRRTSPIRTRVLPRFRRRRPGASTPARGPRTPWGLGSARRSASESKRTSIRHEESAGSSDDASRPAGERRLSDRCAARSSGAGQLREPGTPNGVAALAVQDVPRRLVAPTCLAPVSTPPVWRFNPRKGGSPAPFGLWFRSPVSGVLRLRH